MTEEWQNKSAKIKSGMSAQSNRCHELTGEELRQVAREEKVYFAFTSLSIQKTFRPTRVVSAQKGFCKKLKESKIVYHKSIVPFQQYPYINFGALAD